MLRLRTSDDHIVVSRQDRMMLNPTKSNFDHRQIIFLLCSSLDSGSYEGNERITHNNAFKITDAVHLGSGEEQTPEESAGLKCGIESSTLYKFVFAPHIPAKKSTTLE